MNVPYLFKLMLFNNSSLPLLTIVVLGIAIIVLDVLIYTKYINRFFCLGNVNKNYNNLIINSLIVVTIVVILSVFIHTFFNITFKDLFPTIYCSIDSLPSPETVSQEIRLNIGVLMHIHNHFPDIIDYNYDIVHSSNFYNKLFTQSGQLGYTRLNGLNVYTIKVNNSIYTIKPNIIEQAYEAYGIP